jgi:hypothetical protein
MIESESIFAPDGENLYRDDREMIARAVGRAMVESGCRPAPCNDRCRISDIGAALSNRMHHALNAKLGHEGRSALRALENCLRIWRDR